jgi:hypothetical protein
VRGRTVRRPQESVTTNHIKIPRAILEQHQRVTLAVNVVFINRVPFLVSVSQGINSVTAEHMPSHTAKQLAAGIRCIMDLYSCGEFQVGTVLMDNKFEMLRVLIPILVMNTIAAKDHLPEVERRIRLIKEHGRGILNTLLFKKMPQIMLIKLIYHVVLWLNAFPTKSGVSKMLLPCKIVYRHKLDFAKHCKAQFGTYCKTNNEPTPTNTNGHSINSGNHSWPNRKSTRHLQVFQHDRWKKVQAIEADSIPHVRIHHQESGMIWQVQRPAEYTQLCRQKWNSVRVEQ